MKLIVRDKNNVHRMNKFLECIICIITYAIIILLIDLCFNTINISNDYYGLWALITSSIIYLLNNTIKPILFKLTIPITGITMGLFYPCINILILKITDIILGKYFDTHGIITLFLTAILISVMNIIMNEIIVKPIMRKGDKK